MSEISQGAKVKWEWGLGTATGTAQNAFVESVKRTLKGSEIARNGSDDDPALLIKQKDGDEALKLRSEVTAA